MKSKILAGFVLMLACGCMVGPDYHSPKTSLPSSWLGVSETHQPSIATDRPPDLARWWRQFEDATLNSLIEEALKANLNLAIAEARLREARALRGVAAGGLWPSVSASASYQRQSGPQDTDRDFHNFYQARLDAVWELDFFGGVRRSVESAGANVQAAGDGIKDAQVSLVAEVALAYIGLRGYQQQIVTARNNLKVQQQTADINRRLFNVGFLSGLEVASSESLVARTESQIPVFETGARQSIYALSVLLARQPGDLVERLSPTGDLAAVPEEIPAGLPSDLLRRRPDIRVAEAQLHGATAQIGVAVAQLFPNFALTGGANWQASKIDKWWRNASRSLFIGPSATWSLFQGGATISNIHAQEALRDQTLLAYQQTVLTALQEVENALVAFTNEQQHYKSLSDAVFADRKAVDLSLRLYKEGQTDYLNVLSAQLLQYADENALTLSRQAIATDLIALYKALGGGWEPTPAY